MKKILNNIWINKIYLILILIVFLAVGFGYTNFLTSNSGDTNHVRDMLIFAAIGLVMDILFIVIYNFSDRSIKDFSEIKNAGFNVLASIPVFNGDIDLIIDDSDNEEAIQSFNNLQESINNACENAKTILISSVNQGEGKSTIAANLACAYAKEGKRALIVDADMDSGIQNSIFLVRNKTGLTNFLIDADSEDNLESISTYIQATKEENLFVMTCGSRTSNPTDLLEDSAKVKETFDVLGLIYDVIIIDTAAYKESAGCTLLADIADVTVITLEQGKTSKDALIKLKNNLEECGTNVAGIVFNKADSIEDIDTEEDSSTNVAGGISNKIDEDEVETNVIEIDYKDDIEEPALDKESELEEPKTRIFAVQESNESTTKSFAIKSREGFDEVDDFEEDIDGDNEISQEGEINQVSEPKGSVEQLISRLNKNKDKSNFLTNTDEDEKEAIESNYVSSSYDIKDSGEFNLQYANIGNELNNIKKIFERVLLSNDERRKEAQITQNEIAVLKDKLDDLKLICTSLNIAGSTKTSEKTKEEIDRLETVYNASQDEDPEYVNGIAQKLDNTKDLYFKSMDFENSVSAQTIEKIEDVKELIYDLKSYIDRKLDLSGNDEGIDLIKDELSGIEESYGEKFDIKLKKLEESIIDNINLKRNEDIKDYIYEMQTEYAKDLENKFAQLQDSISSNINSGDVNVKVDNIKDEYYERLHDECMALQECIVANSNKERIERVLNEIQNVNSLELSHKIDEIKDVFAGENIDFTKIDGKLEELKEYNSNEFRDKLQSFYNMYSSELDDSIERIKEYQNDKFENLKYYGEKAVEDLKNFEEENVNFLKDRMDEMEERYAIELSNKVEDMQNYYAASADKITEYNEEKFNEIKDKIDDFQDRYLVELEGKLADAQESFTGKLDEATELNQDYFANKFDEMFELNKEHYVNKFDEMMETNQEQLDSLRDDIVKVQEVCNSLTNIISEANQAQLEELTSKLDVFEKRIIDLQKMQNQNSKSAELKEVKEEIKNLKTIYNDNIKAEFEGLQNKLGGKDIEDVVATLRSDMAKLNKRIKTKDTTIEDEIYNMKQELIKLRKEIENKPDTTSATSSVFGGMSAFSSSKKRSKAPAMPANVYKYSDYEDVPEKKGLFGRRQQPKMPASDINDAPAAASSISQILKF